jgi:hypothetical protein
MARAVVAVSGWLSFLPTLPILIPPSLPCLTLPSPIVFFLILHTLVLSCLRVAAGVGANSTDYQVFLSRSQVSPRPSPTLSTSTHTSTSTHISTHTSIPTISIPTF